MKTTITKKSYYLLTHPDVKYCYIKNYGDRQFEVRGNNGRWTEFPTVAIKGDLKWEITEENIQKAANAIFEDKIKEEELEKTQKPKNKDGINIWDEFDGIFDKMNNLFDSVFKKR